MRPLRILLLYNKPIENPTGIVLKELRGRTEGYDLDSFESALKKAGHSVVRMAFDKDSYAKLEEMRKKIDIVFNLCDTGINMDSSLEPHILAILEILGYPVVGPDSFAIAFCTRKDLVKHIFQCNGITTPAFQIFEKVDEPLSRQLHFPLIVKPVREDGSLGVYEDSIVDNERDLRSRIKRIVKEYNQPAIVEEFIDGREFTCCVLGGAKPRVLPPAELQFQLLPKQSRGIYSYEAKWVWDPVDDPLPIVRCDFKLDSNLRKQIMQLALRSYILMGCRDYARVDVRIKKNKYPYVLEVNPNPDICKVSMYATAAKADGMDFTAMINAILECAIKRYGLDKPRKK